MKFGFSILTALVLCSTTVLAEKQPIKVGALIVLTGQYAMQGNAFREGLELGVDLINAEGGIAGNRVELRVEDTANLPTQALTAARKLISTDKVMAAITTSYPELATGAAEFQKSKIAVIHVWDSSPDIEKMGEYIFGIGPWTPSSGEVSAQFAFKKLAARTAVVINVNDPWSRLVSEYFTAEFKNLGGQIVGSYSFNPDERDFRSILTKVRARNPDLIYSPITDNIVAFYTQLKQFAPKIAVISSDVIADEHVAKAPAVFEGIYHSQILDPSGDEMKKLAARYEQKFGHAPKLPWFVATAYDAMMILRPCLERTPNDTSAIRDCVSQTKNLQGASHQISFTPGGSSKQNESIFKILAGKFVFEWKNESDSGS